MKIHSVYDAGETVGDRYTVYYKGRGSRDFVQGQTMRFYVGMSGAPFHPQGICLHGYGLPGKNNGKRIAFEDLPQDCQKAALQ